MATQTRAGRFIWPGVQSPVAGMYTISHGASPGIAELRILPQDPGLIAMTGDLVIDDGVKKIVVPGCKVDKIRREFDGDGWYDIMVIFDWRWKWRFGFVKGLYNQLDKRGKLIGFTIKSPRELCEECIAQMSDTGKVFIDMPDGYTSAQGAAHFAVEPPWIGVNNFGGTNPLVNWDPPTLPAQALQELCDTYGRVIVPRLSTQSTAIVVPGSGDGLPSGGSIATEIAGFDPPEVPSGIGVFGSPTRVQMRFLLGPVGEEWHGGYVPINELSYIPHDEDGTATWRRADIPTFTSVRSTNRLSHGEAVELAQRSVFRAYRIINIDVSCSGSMTHNVDGNVQFLRQVPIIVPGYGEIERRQQLIILDTQVEWVEPPTTNPILLDANGFNAIENHYNGFVREKPAEVFGVTAYLNRHMMWMYTDGPVNTLPITFNLANSATTGLPKIFVPFQVVPNEQMIVFAEPVFKIDDRTAAIKDYGWIAPPDKLILQTSINLRDPNDNSLFRHHAIRYLRGSDKTQVLIKHYPDVQANIIGEYIYNRLQGINKLENEDTNARCNRYLDGMQAQYMNFESQTKVYNGFENINLTGAVRQVTWKFDEKTGCSTTASVNTEHSLFIPSYGARRRREFLEPAQLHALSSNMHPDRIGNRIITGAEMLEDRVRYGVGSSYW